MPHEGILQELEEAIGGSIARKADVLRRVTDLFMAGSGHYADDQVGLFDLVMTKLSEGIAAEAKAAVSARISSAPDAPRNVVRTFAFDADIEIAGPVLQKSDRLMMQDLVAIASTMGQEHMELIASRAVVEKELTDVLIHRGNSCVVAAVATNLGSRFSEHGLNQLVTKCSDDADLAVRILVRSDIPRQTQVELFERISDELKHSLELARPHQAETIHSIVALASESARQQARLLSREYAVADNFVRSLNAKSKLNEAAVRGFADNRDFDCTVIALSILLQMPVGAVERALVHKRPEQIMVSARSVDFGWDTAKSLLSLSADKRPMTAAEIKKWSATYKQLRVDTAVLAMQFYRLREKSAESTGPAMLSKR